MKRCILLLLLIGLPLATSFATVLTVSNGKIKAQYVQITEAIAAATDGDTIYVHASPTNYSDITVNKQLVIIGAGHRQLLDEGATSTHTAFVNRINFNTTGSGTTLLGMDIGYITVSRWQAASGVSILRCRIRGTGSSYLSYQTSGTGGLVEGCRIDNNLWYHPSSGNTEGLQFTNNVFGKGATLRFESRHDVIVTNNVFLGDFDAPTDLNNSTLQGVVFSDNIIYGRKLNTSATENFFTNNIIYTSGLTAIWDGNFNVNNSNKFVDPLFVNLPADTDGNWSYDYDLSLQANSPGKGTGTDGQSDVGLRPTFNKSGTPYIPQLISFELLTPNVAQDGEVRFRIKARSENAGEF